jgi:branched-chain amino acid transport system ATP-binding protein
METNPILEITDLHVFRGASHILQGVSLQIGAAPLALVGRNGMGKTTLCEALMGLLPVGGGAIRLGTKEIAGQQPFRIAQAGVGYVPQGRRVFPSLSVHEHLAMVAKPGSRPGGWTIERVYATFPRLAERRRNGGAQLSGGEQQMLAVARALLLNPVLLVMDEPTEGLAPVIVEALSAVLAQLRADSTLSIILVEQNSRVALTFSPRTVILDKGRIVYDGESEPLRSDPERLAKLIGIVL